MGRGKAWAGHVSQGVTAKLDVKGAQGERGWAMIRGGEEQGWEGLDNQAGAG